MWFVYFVVPNCSATKSVLWEKFPTLQRTAVRVNGPATRLQIWPADGFSRTPLAAIPVERFTERMDPQIYKISAD